MIAGFEGRSVCESARLADYRAAEFFEAFPAVVRLDRSHDIMHMGHDFREVDDWFGGGNAEIAGLTKTMGMPGSGNQRLGRNTAVVQAVAAHSASFDEDHFAAQLCSGGGDGQAARTCSDDAEI